MSLSLNCFKYDLSINSLLRYIIMSGFILGDKYQTNPKNLLLSPK